MRTASMGEPGKESGCWECGKKGHLKHEEEGEFEDERITRPKGRDSKISAQDGGLNIKNRQDIDDSEDYGTTRMRKRIE